MSIKPGTKRVLLCGGPADCQTVDVAGNATVYTFTEVKEERGPIFLGQSHDIFTTPTYGYVRHLYQIIGHHQASGLFVAVHENINQADHYVAVEHTLKKAGLFTASTMRRTDLLVPSVRGHEMAWATNPLLPSDESLKEASRIAWKELAARYDPLKIKEPAKVDDGLTHITIKTRKPDKWRFIDTETGETWRWDVAQNKFVKVVYTHE